MSDVSASLSNVVELSSAARTGKGLLSLALPLPPGWQDGIRFRPAGCVTPELIGECVTDNADPDRVADGVEFRPVYIRQSATCSTLSMVQPGNRAVERLVGTTEWGLGRLLADGFAGLNNVSFADATLVASADDPVAAVACLEQAIADTGYGNRAFLHAPYRAAAYIKDRYGLDEGGMSPAGNQWIISAGYPAEDADTVTIWATGPVWAGADPIEMLDRTNFTPRFRENDDSAFAQRLALVAFDPCLNFAATFPAASCGGGS